MMERLDMYAVNDNAQIWAAEAVNKLEAILKESPASRPAAADSGSNPVAAFPLNVTHLSYDGADQTR